jgi:arylsulfatase A-like enzyme
MADLESIGTAALQSLEEARGRRAVVWLGVGMSPASWTPSADRLAHWLKDRTPIDLCGELAGVIDESLSIDVIDALRDTYAARVEELDQLWARLWEGLTSIGTLDETLVVLTADEGYPLGEHGAVGFSRPWVHEERDHVPMVMRLPGGRPAQRSSALVTHADLAATIGDWLDIDSSADASSSLLPILRGEEMSLRTSLVSGFVDVEYAVRTRDWKLILPVRPVGSDRRRQLYSKPEDRWEVNDLVDQRVVIADELETQLRQHVGIEQ